MASTITDRIAGSVNGQPVSLGGFAIIQVTTVSGTDTVLGTASPDISAYTANQYFSIRPVNANTGPVDVNFSSKGLANLLSPNGTELVAGQFDPNFEYLIKCVSSTEFRIHSPW